MSASKRKSDLKNAELNADSAKKEKLDDRKNEHLEDTKKEKPNVGKERMDDNTLKEKKNIGADSGSKEVERDDKVKNGNTDSASEALISDVEAECPDFLFDSLYQADEPEEPEIEPAEPGSQDSQLAVGYQSVFVDNLEVFQGRRVSDVYFSIRLPENANRPLYGEWNALVMRLLQERFKMSLKHIKWVQQQITATGVDVKAKLTDMASLKQKSKLQAPLLQTLCDKVLVHGPNLPFRPEFESQVHECAEDGWAGALKRDGITVIDAQQQSRGAPQIEKFHPEFKTPTVPPTESRDLNRTTTEPTPMDLGDEVEIMEISPTVENVKSSRSDRRSDGRARERDSSRKTAESMIRPSPSRSKPKRYESDKGPPVPPASISMPKIVSMGAGTPFDRLWNHLASLSKSITGDKEICEALGNIPNDMYVIFHTAAASDGWSLKVNVCGKEYSVTGVSEIGAHVKVIGSLFPLERLLSFFLKHKINWGPQAQREPWGEYIYESVKKVLAEMFQFLQAHEEPKCDRLPEVLLEFEQKAPDFAMHLRESERSARSESRWVCTMHLYCAVVVGRGSTVYDACLDALRLAVDLPFQDGPESTKRMWRLVVDGWKPLKITDFEKPRARGRRSNNMYLRINRVCRSTFDWMTMCGSLKTVGVDGFTFDIVHAREKRYQVSISFTSSNDPKVAITSFTTGYGQTVMLALCNAFAKQLKLFTCPQFSFLTRTLAARCLELRPQSSWRSILEELVSMAASRQSSLQVWMSKFMDSKLSEGYGKETFEEWIMAPSDTDCLILLYLACQGQRRFSAREADDFKKSLTEVQADSEPRQVPTKVKAKKTDGIPPLFQPQPLIPQAQSSHGQGMMPSHGQGMMPSHGQGMMHPFPPPEAFGFPSFLAALPAGMPMPGLGEEQGTIGLNDLQPENFEDVPTHGRSMPVQQNPFQAVKKQPVLLSLVDSSGRFGLIEDVPDRKLGPPATVPKLEKVALSRPRDAFWNKLVAIPPTFGDKPFVEAITKISPEHLKNINSKRSGRPPALDWRIDATICDKKFKATGLNEAGAFANLLMAAFPLNHVLAFLARHNNSWTKQAKRETWGKKLFTKVKQVITTLFTCLKISDEINTDRLPQKLVDFASQCPDFAIDLYNFTKKGRSEWECTIYLHACMVSGSGSSQHKACVSALASVLRLAEDLWSSGDVKQWNEALDDWDSVSFNYGEVCSHRFASTFCNKVNTVAKMALRHPKLQSSDIKSVNIQSILMPGDDMGIQISVKVHDNKRGQMDTMDFRASAEDSSTSFCYAMLDLLSELLKKVPSSEVYQFFLSIMAKVLHLRFQTGWLDCVDRMRSANTEAAGWMRQFLARNVDQLGEWGAQEFFDPPPTNILVAFMFLALNFETQGVRLMQADEFVEKKPVQGVGGTANLDSPSDGECEPIESEWNPILQFLRKNIKSTAYESLRFQIGCTFADNNATCLTAGYDIIFRQKPPSVVEDGFAFSFKTTQRGTTFEHAFFRVMNEIRKSSSAGQYVVIKMCFEMCDFLKVPVSQYAAMNEEIYNFLFAIQNPEIRSWLQENLPKPGANPHWIALTNSSEWTLTLTVFAMYMKAFGQKFHRDRVEAWFTQTSMGKPVAFSGGAPDDTGMEMDVDT